MHFLTGDLGNSSCKLRLWRTDGSLGATRVAAADWPSSPGLGAQISAWLASHPGAEGCAISSVAAAELESELERALDGSQGGASASRAPDPGLEIGCSGPHKIGRDRLYAARGALELCREDAIVVDAGTALTVDAVRADGTFLGGAIAPGPSLLAEVLSRGTARLPRIDPRPGARALGRNTEEALQAGVVLGFRGAARELALEVAAESGIAPAVVLLTGGARRFLLDPSVFGALRVLEEEDLVHVGLLAASGIPYSREPR